MHDVTLFFNFIAVSMSLQSVAIKPQLTQVIGSTSVSFCAGNASSFAQVALYIFRRGQGCPLSE